MSARLDLPGGAALAAVLAALPRARLVGGAVRDLLAGREVADIDLATPEPPEEVARLLAASDLRAIPTGAAHGTLTALSAGQAFEITTLRRDVATDGRHARVAWTEDWLEDASRRDFTINAMSLDRDGVVHDPFGGCADLAAGRVRFVGDPARRIAEDRLRALRFFRFFARYGTGEPDAPALAAIADAAGDLGALSPERVWAELRRILTAPPRAIAPMRRTGVLASVLPEASAEGEEALVRLAGLDAPADPLLRLSALAPGGEPDALAARLRLSGAEASRLAALLAANPVLPPDADDASLRRALADHPASLLADRAWLDAARLGGEEWAALRERLASTPAPVFPLAGRDVVAAGLAPGPAVGEALRQVRAWWLAGGCVAGREAALAELCRRLRG